MQPRIRKAVIPAAGLGIRFLPATKAQPKEMLPVVDKPIIQYVVEEAVAAGIRDILLITGRGKRAIEDHFDRSQEIETALLRRSDTVLLDQVREIGSLSNIHFVRQKEPLGLGHAIYQAKSFIGDEPFAVLLGDEIFRGTMPCLKELTDLFDHCGGNVVGLKHVAPSNVGRYGIVRMEDPICRLGRIVDMVEKPAPAEAPSNLAIVGRYILDPKIFSMLETLPPGRSGEIQLTDALRLFCPSGQVFGHVVNAERFDVGDKLGFLKANIEFALERPELSTELFDFLGSLSDRRRQEHTKRQTSGTG